MVDAPTDQGGAAPQAAQDAKPKEPAKPSGDADLQAQLEENTRILAGKDRTLTDFQEGRRMPKWMEEQGWTMEGGRPVPPESLFAGPAATARPSAGRVKLDQDSDGRPLPPDPEQFRNEDSGDVDKVALQRAQVAYEDAVWDYRRGGEAEEAREKAVKEVAATLPESFRSTEDDAAVCEDLIAVHAERIARGRTPTREDVVAARDSVLATLERQAKTRLAEIDAAVKTNRKSEPTQLGDLPGGRAPEDTGPPPDPYSPEAQKHILDQRAGARG